MTAATAGPKFAPAITEPIINGCSAWGTLCDNEWTRMYPLIASVRVAPFDSPGQAPVRWHGYGAVDGRTFADAADHLSLPCGALRNVNFSFTTGLPRPTAAWLSSHELPASTPAALRPGPLPDELQEAIAPGLPDTRPGGKPHH